MSDSNTEITHNVGLAIDAIKRLSKSGKFKPGSVLPSLRKISDEIGINRQTVWQAMRFLEKENWVISTKNGRYQLSEIAEEKIFRNLKVCMITRGQRYIRFSGHQELYYRMHEKLKAFGIDLDLELYDLDQEVLKLDHLNAYDLLILVGQVNGLRDTISTMQVRTMGINVDYSMKCDHTVNPDSFRGGSLAAEYAIENAFDSVVIAGFQKHTPWVHAELRFDGFKNKWLEAGNDPSKVKRIVVEETQNHFRDLQTLHSELRKIEAAPLYFCLDERCSIGVVNYLELQGVLVPDQARVIGYDVWNYSRYTHRAVSSFEQDFSTMIDSAIQLIQDDLDGSQVIKVPVRLIHRETS